MEYIPLDITVMSAQGIKNVNMFMKMDVYAVVSIAGDHTTNRRTPVDKNGGKNPSWNHRVQFALPHPSLPHLSLHFVLKTDSSLGDKVIGEVTVPVRELLDAGNKASERVVDYQVRTVTGKTKGILKFSYKFGDKFTQEVPVPPLSKNVGEPVTAYPAATAYPAPPGMGHAMPHPAPYPGGAYGAPAPGYGGYPPAPNYNGGYPPVAPGYGGYPGQQMGYMQQPHKGKKKMGGNKLGLGLGAGLLGGLLVGDMISDVGEMSAYDGGFDDGGMDFDF